MGQLTQTTAQIQVILDNTDAANVGKTSLTDASDTTAVALKKSGFYSLQGSSSNAPSTDRAVIMSAVRDTAATGEIRYGQVAITESNGLWWNSDDGGSLGTWYEAVSTAGTQTLTNKTLTSAVLTTPQINDSAADHQYVFAAANLAADRTVTLPLLTGNDTFVFEAHTQTLTNKTLTTPTVSALTLSDASIIFEGATANAYETTLTVTDPTADRTLTLPNATDTLVGRDTTDTLTNKTLTSPDVNTPDIDGGTLDGTTIGASTAAAITGTTLVANTSINIAGDGATVTGIKDEDDMSSNSAVKLATQQSIKAYVDSQVGTVDTLSEILANGNTTGANDIDVDAAQKVQFRDAAIYINSSVDGQLDIVADTEIQIAATTIDINGAIVASGEISAASLDISGDVDIDGTLNVDAIDIDGAVQLDNTLTVGVDDTGYDVKFYGATGGAYMLWDESADDLILAGAAGLSVAGASTLTGVVTANAGIDIDNINIDGTTLALSSGDLTLDVAGNINLDADGGGIALKDGGTQYGLIFKNSNDLEIYSHVQDGDIKLRGNDGGSGIVALTLDMSAAGTAIFNDNVGIGQAPTAFANWRVLELKAGSAGAMVNYEDSSSARVAALAYDETGTQLRIQTMVDAPITFEPNNAVALTLDGTQNAAFTGHVDLVDNKELRLGSGNDYKFDYDGSRLNVIGTGDTVFDITGDFYIDADGADIIFQDGGTSFAEHDKDGNNYRIKNPIADGDILIQGSDAGSIVTALSLDMSAAGAATFNSSVTATGALFSGTSPLDVRMGTDKRIFFSGAIGEIGSVAGFQSLNTAGNALAGFGIRASSIALATSSNTRLLLSDNGAITATPSANGHAVFNNAGVDADFQVQSDTYTHALFVQGSDGNVGIGLTPTEHLHVGGRANAVLELQSSTTTGTGRVNFNDGANSGQILYAHTANTMDFYSGGSYAMRLTSTGITAPQGIFIGGTGTGNKLDDYEEGTWTPALSTGTHSYSEQTGKYTKIGNQITVWGRMILSSRGSNASELGVSGLPVASAGSPYASTFGMSNTYGTAGLLPEAVAPTGGSIEGSIAYLRNQYATNGSYTVNDLNSSGGFTFALTYMTA